MPLLIILFLLSAAFFSPPAQLPPTQAPMIEQVISEEEKLDLPFRPAKLATDELAEKEMLTLINQERKSAGLSELELDLQLSVIARAHSVDMWQRQYFAHVNPDGKDPFERMKEGQAEFVTAGENLALARNVERAHEGLMHSEGHRRNILDPKFSRVGIGIIDGGIYGEMFTQDFAD